MRPNRAVRLREHLHCAWSLSSRRKGTLTRCRCAAHVSSPAEDAGTPRAAEVMGEGEAVNGHLGGLELQRDPQILRLAGGQLLDRLRLPRAHLLLAHDVPVVQLQHGTKLGWTSTLSCSELHAALLTCVTMSSQDVQLCCNDAASPAPASPQRAAAAHPAPALERHRACKICNVVPTYV
jgi:hypothetical protein